MAVSRRGNCLLVGGGDGAVRSFVFVYLCFVFLYLYTCLLYLVVYLYNQFNAKQQNIYIKTF